MNGIHAGTSVCEIFWIVRNKDGWGGVDMIQLRPAHYALYVSIDDVVMNTPWRDTGGWDVYTLVSTFHQKVREGTGSLICSGR